MTNETPILLNRAGASAYLEQRHGIVRTVGTLAKYAVTGGGPRFRKVGTKQVRYSVPDLDLWAAEIISAPLSSTSELAA